MGRLFGADGVRGIAINEFSTDAAMHIGRATAITLAKRTNRKVKILIGKDSRISCNVLEAALVAGICSAGADVCILGVVPAPAVAYLTVKYGADAGIAITGSHNSYEYNGLKLYSSSGRLMDKDIEDEIDDLIFDAKRDTRLMGYENIGNVYNEKNGEWDYVRHLLSNVTGNFSRLRIVVDCGNGAASSTAVKFFKGLGASVIFINNEPNGVNINSDCGSTDTAALSQAVVKNRAHAGIALDGDGDRCVMVDENGDLIDGDMILAILALEMRRNGTLSSNTCVVTQMTNLGFFRWAKDTGIVVSTASEVGDRYVLERMLSDGYNLGGEQSGQIILKDAATTADGQLAAAKVLEILARGGRKMSEIAGVFTPYPQILINVRLRRSARGMWKNVSEINEMISFCSEKLEGEGRVFVRESGTEPILRILAEGRDKEAIYQYAHAIEQVVKMYLGEAE